MDDINQMNLDTLRELTKALTPISDMAILMDVPECELRDVLSDPDQRAARIYRRTKAETALRLREINIELAESGSPVATQAVMGYLKDIQDE